MIIIAGGDSFIFGNELRDQQESMFSSKTFPAILAQGAEYHCAAWPGNANNAISRMTMAACERFKKQKPIVIVTWTFCQRYEFRFNYSTKQRISPWYSVNSWTADNPSAKTLKDIFVTDDGIIIKEQLLNLETAQQTGTADFAAEFYKHVGNSEYYELYTSFKEFVFLQNYFKVNKIPYLMITAENNFYKHENYIRSKDTYLEDLYNQIDWTNWFFFPEGTAANETTEPRGFYQWAVENKYPVGTSHPLEQAHAAAAELIKEKFNELVTKSSKSN
jgi:hypothetical protein